MSDSPLIEGAKSLEQRFEKYAGKIPTPGYKPRDKYAADPNDVRAATESFTKKGVGAKTSVAKQKAKVGQRKSAKKRY